jgi:hypothetical protein
VPARARTASYSKAAAQHGIALTEVGQSLPNASDTSATASTSEVQAFGQMNGAGDAPSDFAPISVAVLVAVAI